MMTSRERFLKVINGEMPDRVPSTLFLADQGHYLSQLYPDIDPWDSTALQIKVIEYQKSLGLDVFVRLLYGVCDPIHWIYGGLDVTNQTENWEVTTVDVQNGNTLIKRSTIRTPKGTLTQDFSINELRPGTLMFACTKKPVCGPDDLEIAIEYEPRMAPSWPAQVKERIRPVREALGDSGILGTWSPHGPFNTASLIIDHEQLYSLFRTEPDYYDRLMNFSIDRVADYLKAIDEAGVDVHCIGGNVPGGMLGRKNYDKYVLPYEKRYIDLVQANGTPAMYHNCGLVMALVESYKDLGAQIVEPFSPHPLGDADLAKARALVDGAYVMLSGIDQVNVIQNGTADDVVAATRKAMEIGKPGGKFIMQPVDFLEWGTPEANVEAYAKTALECGWY